MQAGPDVDRSRQTFRALALAAGLYFLGSGLWGILTETPADRAARGCEAVASERAADPSAAVAHTQVSEDRPGWWLVTGEVRQSVDNVPTLTFRWECTADDDGKNAAITAWTGN